MYKVKIENSPSSLQRFTTKSQATIFFHASCIGLQIMGDKKTNVSLSQRVNGKNVELYSRKSEYLNLDSSAIKQILLVN